jgi:hypothetical protein
MPDNGVSSLYPQPPSQQQNTNSLLSNPLAATGILNNLLQLQQRQQELNARNAIGSAVQDAISPSGDYDPSAAMSAVKNNPAAAYGAPDAVTQLLQHRQLQIANGRQQFELAAGQNKFVTDTIGSLADDPNLDINSVRNATVTAARNSGVPSGILAGWLNSLPTNPKQLRSYMVNLRNMTRGASEAGQPSNQPIGYTGQGAPVYGTQGQYGYGATGQGGIIAPPPGFGERQTGYAQMDSALAKNLADAAEGSQGRRAILGNLEDALDKFTSGPGADYSKVAKSFINRNIPLPAGWQFDPKSIASQEEFVKQAQTLAQQQFAAIGGTGTDAKFASAFETNPNDTLSQLGNKGIIKLLKGNEDALQAKNSAWLNASGLNPNLSYRQFSSYFNSQFDPRVFQFKYMNKTERNEYVSKMNPDDFNRLMTDIAAARRQSWINY